MGHEVLEVGCGNGNFTELLTQKSPWVVAVDLNEEYVKAAKTRLKEKPGVEVLVADATQLQWEHSFDSLILLDVLEHIEDDVQMLRQLCSFLKPGGKLVIKVTALDCLYSPMDKAIGHYRRYDKKTLIKKTFRKKVYSSIWFGTSTWLEFLVEGFAFGVYFEKANFSLSLLLPLYLNQLFIIKG